MADPLLRNLSVSEALGVQFACIQRWLKQCCVAAGISIVSDDPLLIDLSITAPPGVQFATLQRWIRLLSEGISSGSGGPGGTITSLAELAAIPTVDLTPPVLKIFVDESTGGLNVWRLLAGTDATGPGVQRPDDYGPTNLRVWYQAST